MTFVEAFYSFKMEINNVDTGRAGRVRLKTPRHPYEPLKHLYARTLAFIHAWEEKLEFSHGYFAPEEPTIWKRDILKNFEQWIEVGCPSRKKVVTALRTALPDPTPTRYSIYFYDQEHINRFCAELRGSKENWISDLNFYRIPDETLEDLIPLERSSSVWSATVIDGTLYLDCDGREIITTIEPLNMWDEFQTSINNVRA